ncbi:MAG: FG-GAP-like repeat-containing protein, partial [Saprospiraceae bacterium]
NIEDPAFIYRNDVKGYHWLEIDVREKAGNTYGIGATADLYAKDIHQHQQLITNKGFFSSSEPVLHFGLGETAMIDSIILQWPEGQREIMKSISPDKRILWKTGTGETYKGYSLAKPELLFSEATKIPGWVHHENSFVDFKREKLLPYMLSAEGPCIATGDINGDNLDDLYVGNGSGYPKALFIQNANNTFTESTNQVFVRDSIYEDCGSVMEDFDGDGDKDLIVISGGSSFNANDPNYMSRYYLNDGKGNFSRTLEFPIIRTNAGAVIAIDYDRDNDPDVIIAGRSTPGRYPEYPRSYLLRNDKGKFTDVTHEVFPELENLGMITDMKSGDLDGDQNPEIIFVGEWLPITIFSFDKSKFQNRTASFGLEKTTGWWKSVLLADMDNDGDLDLFAGNIGLNSRLKTSEQLPITLYTKDFDGNGSLDPVLCFYFNDKLYPYAGKDALIGQIPRLKKKFVRYTPYASATIKDIFTTDELNGSTILTANTFQTVYLVNENKKFVSHTLPYQVQFAPVFDMVVEDFNQDGKKDILMAGNFSYSETETGEMDAGNGTLLLQNPDGSFRYVPNLEHGFWAQDEVREIKLITRADGQKEVVTINNKGPIQLHTLVVTTGAVQ